LKYANRIKAYFSQVYPKSQCELIKDAKVTGDLIVKINGQSVIYDKK